MEDEDWQVMFVSRNETGDFDQQFLFRINFELQPPADLRTGDWLTKTKKSIKYVSSRLCGDYAHRSSEAFFFLFAHRIIDNQQNTVPPQNSPHKLG